MIVSVPPSKSVTQRAIVLAALGESPCVVECPLDCDDSRAMVAGLRALGVSVDDEAETWTVRPPARLRAPSITLLLGNAGTAVRFITGLAPVVTGSYVVDGHLAMRRRPMPALLSALRGLGVYVEERGGPGCPPVALDGRAVDSRGRVRARIVAGLSSQELSALLLMGAGLPGGIDIEVVGSVPSRPYVDLTLGVMERFGVRVERRGGAFRVWPGGPRATRFRVEGDWSSASYPLAAGFLTGRRVEVSNVAPDSAQGDRAFPELLESIVSGVGRRIDLRDAPDLAPTVAACALFADGETTIVGAEHLRVKESDRIAVLCRELVKLGARAEERVDGLTIRPGPLRGGVELDPERDHRMAMAFGLVGLRVPGVTVRDAGCVSKSYPDFWRMLETFR